MRACASLHVRGVQRFLVSRSLYHSCTSCDGWISVGVRVVELVYELGGLTAVLIEGPLR